MQPTSDDFSKLKATEHLLQSFAEEPYAAIRASVEQKLKQQAPDSRLEVFTVLSDPEWLTGSRPLNTGTSKTILVRSAVAFEFSLSVESQDQSRPLSGVFTWAAIRLDQPGKRKLRAWIDLGGKLPELGSEGELMNRVHFE